MKGAEENFGDTSSLRTPSAPAPAAQVSGNGGRRGEDTRARFGGREGKGKATRGRQDLGGSHHAEEIRQYQPTKHKKNGKAHLFLFAFVISFRRAGPSRGFRSSNAQSNSSETLSRM